MAPMTPRVRTLREARRHDKRDTVGVYLRLKPYNPDEAVFEKISDQDIKTIQPDGKTQKVYTFTHVFEDASQADIFNRVARPVIEDFIVKAKDGLIFTYGITGSGKTYTMEGEMSNPGLIYRTVDFVFNSIAAQQTQMKVIQSHRDNTYSVQNDQHIYPNLEQHHEDHMKPSHVKWLKSVRETGSVSVDHNKYFAVFISLIDLYNKQVHDLFEDLDSQYDKDRRRLDIRSDQRGISFVANAVEVEVKTADDAKELYRKYVRRRKTGATALNKESSRGHLVLNIKLVQLQKDKNNDKLDENTLTTSQLSLVDLAGSERCKRSQATGEALQEACNINNSLGALRKCIRSLREHNSATLVNYREYSLTRLFKSYFEGIGSVCMILCVNPTIDNYTENAIAMEFGVMTQDVAVDYCSPPKILRKTRTKENNIATMFDECEKIILPSEPSEAGSTENYFDVWIQILKARRDKRKKLVEALTGAQGELRTNFIGTMKENEHLRQIYETKAKEAKNQEEQVKVLKSELGSYQRSRDELKRRNQQIVDDNNAKQKLIEKMRGKMSSVTAQNEELKNWIMTEEERKQKLRKSEWLNTAPSAPKMEPMQCSSPLLHNSPTPSESARQSASPPPTTTTNSSADAAEIESHHHNQHRSRERERERERIHHQIHSHHLQQQQQQQHQDVDVDDDDDHVTNQHVIPGRYSTRDLLVSPTTTAATAPPFNGVAVINPRHNRSLSCSNMQWIHHKPKGTIDTGTVMKPKFNNGRSIRNLRSSDILHKNAAGYSVVHQDADMNGDIETSVYKGDILPTVCGGKQVIINDIETMRQESPKRRRRAASDAHYTH